MAAITPYLEDPTDEVDLPGPTPLAALAGLGDEGGTGAVGTAGDALAYAHAEQTRFVWARRLVEKELLTKKFWLEVERRPESANRGEIVMRVSPEFTKDVIPWSLYPGPDGSPIRDSYPIWGEASKMACPTFDLPAGSPVTGGSCVGATPGQPTVPPEQKDNFLRAKGDGYVLAAPAPGGAVIPYREAQTICAWCVSGDTRVLVRGRGLIEIADLVGAGEVEVWSGKGWRKTLAVCNGVKPTYRVKTSWGAEVRLTADHELIGRDGRVRCDEVEVGDALLPEPPQDTVTFPATAVIMPCEDYATDGSQRRVNAVAEHFPTAWDFGVGLVLGYVLGDGSVDAGEYPTVRVVAGMDDRNDLERLNEIVKTWCSTQAEVKDREDDFGGSDVARGSGRSSTIAWRVKGLAAFLQHLGLVKRADPAARRAPSTIWTASLDGVRGFLSGLFSTDGSVGVTAGKKVEVSLAAVSLPLLRDVQQLLFALGIRSTICEYATSNESRVAAGYHRLYKLSIGAKVAVRRFMEVVGFFNERKAAKLAEGFAGLSDGAVPRYPTVMSVEATGVEEPVYDLLNVGEEHQFTANGVSVSNCYATGGNYSYANIAAGQILRYWWIRSLLQQPGGDDEFARIVVESLKRRRFPAGEPGGLLPVRLHSSGDFYSPAYAAAWVKAANLAAKASPKIVFWAPTRTWAARGWTGAWPQILARLDTPNLVVRPSGYHIGDAAPEALAVIQKPGWSGPLAARGTTSMTREQNERSRGGTEPRADRDCPVYSLTGGKGEQKPGEDKLTCRTARNPLYGQPGQPEYGCRMCWTAPGLTVNYTTH